MSHLVRLEGKHTTQNAHCAVQTVQTYKANYVCYCTRVKYDVRSFAAVYFAKNVSKRQNES